MNSKIVSFVAMLVVLSGGVGAVGATTATTATAENCTFPVTQTDATGTDVTVDEKPERVVTLSPSAAQTMWEIGAEEQVVGTTMHAHYLEGAEDRTNVSGEGQTYINTEVVVSLEPDLVLAPDVVADDTVTELRDAGLTVYKFGPATSLEDIYAATERTGELTGNCDSAEETVTWMQDEIGAVEEAVAGEDKPRVLYTFFGWTAGEGTFIDTIIETAGGTNVAAEAGIDGYAEISEETVVDQNPEWLVLNSDSPMVPDSEAYQNTHAVENDQTVTLDTNLLNQPGPRVVYAVQTLAETMHPEAFDASSESTQQETTEDTETTAGTEETTDADQNEDDSPATETPGQPGFGVPAVVVALTLWGFVWRRN